MNKTLLLVIFLLFFFFLTSQGQYLYEWEIGSEALGLTQVVSPTDITIDEQGNTYVIDQGNFFIQKFNANGQLVLKFGSYGTSDGQLNTPVDIAVDNKGNIYIVDNNSRIQKFDSTGKLLLKFGSYGNEDGKFISASSIAVDGQGNIFVSDETKICIQKFDSNGQFLLKFGSSGLGNGQFISWPSDIAVDKQGNIYVSQYSSYILKFNSNGKFLARLTVNGMDLVMAIAVDGQGRLYITGNRDGRYLVRKVSASGQFIAEFVNYGRADGQFEFPAGIAVDGPGNVYVCDQLNNSLQKISSTGSLLWKIVSTANGQFSFPRQATVSKEGNIYVVDQRNYRIQIFSPNGQFLFKFGSRGTDDAQFTLPMSIGVDTEGNIYVVDLGSYSVKKFSPKGEYLAKFGSQGDGDGQLYSATGIAIAKNGDFYVLDKGNHRIQKFSSTGQFLLKFGSKGTGDDQFVNPTDIAIDDQGNVYVTDEGNHCVKKFSSSGKFLFKFGSYGYQDGQFEKPDAIDIDKYGNIYVGCYNITRTYRIQKFSSTGQFLLKFILTGSGSGIAIDEEENLYITDNYHLLKYSPKHTAKSYSYIQGSIYEDSNQDCIRNKDEFPLAGSVVIAQPGPYYGITDSLGNYSIAVDTGSYTVEQILAADSLIKQICPLNNESYRVTLKAYNDTIKGNDFANQRFFEPSLIASLSSDRRRRCFTNATIISYHNTGNAVANDVKVHLQLPEYVVLVSANLPYIAENDRHYIFDIGILQAGAHGKISIIDSVACNNPDIRDLTQCTKVWITPAKTPAPSSDWDKSDISLKAKCTENGLIEMSLHNTGKGHMADSSSFRIYLDAMLVFQHRYKLIAGDSLSLQVPANGQTVRLEADQRPYHPTKQQTSISIEACGKNSEGKVSKGYVAQLPQDEEEPEVDIECLPIVDSFDPNDKLVFPQGVTENHYTPTGRELHYKVRFQNTGTDVAYKVVVIDTLSEHLDISTLQIGAVSHPYQLNVSGKGRPVLSFAFNNINLPDSTKDQLASNGFINFSIKPKERLPEKTIIENYADIFFDFNEPVRTNTVFNSIYDVPAPAANEKVIICKTNSRSLAGNNRSFCEQDTLYLQANAPGAGKGKWKLIKGAGIIHELTNPATLVTNLAYGENIFEWKVPTNSCSTDSTASIVTIHRKATPGTPTITQQGIDSLFCNIVGTSYQWYWNETKLEASTQQIQVSESGNYKVIVSQDGCSSPLSEAFIYQKITTSLEEYASQIKVYPNPATSSVFIELPLEGQAMLTLVDGMGRELKTSIPSDQQKRELLLADIKAGIYILHIETAKGIFVKKLIVR